MKINRLINEPYIDQQEFFQWVEIAKTKDRFLVERKLTKQLNIGPITQFLINLLDERRTSKVPFSEKCMDQVFHLIESYPSSDLEEQILLYVSTKYGYYLGHLLTKKALDYFLQFEELTPIFKSYFNDPNLLVLIKSFHEKFYKELDGQKLLEND